MARTWARILPKMSDEDAHRWLDERSKGKPRWIMRRVLINIGVLALLYVMFRIIDFDFGIVVFVFWFLFGIYEGFRSWSDFEDQYSEYEVAKTLNSET